MFVFDENVAPKEYISRIGFDISHYRLLLLETVDEANRVHQASLQLLDCNSLKYPKLIETAEKYWSDNVSDPVETEILFEGKIKVIKEF